MTGRRLGSRLRVVLVALLALAAATGGLTWYALEVPQSQPALWPQTEPAPQRPPGEPSGRQGPAVLALAGDAMVGRGVARRFERKPGYDPWSALEPVLADVDLLVLNLESAITPETEPFGHKVYRFRLDPDHAHRALGGIPLRPDAARCASVANNHALDFGRQGLLDTVSALDEQGWAHAGAGATAAEARRPAVITTAAGVRVGLIAVADHCSCARMSSWRATDSRPGLWHADLSRGRWGGLLAAVEALDPAVDMVVVSLHWGPNYFDEGEAPAAWMRSLAAALVGAGADVVHGHSAHQVLPVEVVDGRHVIYGSGDLLDDYGLREVERNDLGFVAKIRLDEAGAQELQLVPIRIRGRRVEVLPAADPDHAEVLRRAGGLDFASR